MTTKSQPKKHSLMATSRYKFIVFLLFFIISSSCQKEDEYWYHLTDYSGEVSFNINGEKAEDFFIYAEKATGDSISIFVHKYEGANLSEYLAFSFIPLNSVQNKIKLYDYYDGWFNNPSSPKPHSIFYTTLAGGEEIGDDYDLIEYNQLENYIILESVNGTDIEGSFQVSYTRDTSDVKHSPYPDTLTFSNGYFKTKILR